jgi:hypothetical protein
MSHLLVAFAFVIARVSIALSVGQLCVDCTRYQPDLRYSSITSDGIMELVNSTGEKKNSW